MAKTIQDLREQRKELARSARNLFETTPENGWTDEVKAQYDGYIAEIDNLDASIERQQKLIDVEAAGAQAIRDRADRDDVSLDEAAAQAEQERGVFVAWASGGLENLTEEQRQFVAQRARDVRAAMGTGTPAAGGLLVPDEFVATLLEEVKAYGGVRTVASVISTATGAHFDMPTTDATSEEGELVGESVAVSEQDPTFDTVGIGAYKYSTKSVAVPIELLQDSVINIEAHLRARLAERISRITNRHFTVGTGTGQPNGIVTASGLGHTAAANSGVSYQDLVRMEHSIDPARRQSGSVGWMFHDQTLRLLKEMVDSQNRPLWVPGVASSEPNLLLGHAYTINQHMAQVGASAKSVLFGDFSKYVVRDVMQVALFRMTDSKYIEKGQVGFIGFSRHDGNLLDVSSSGIKHLVHPA